MDHQHIGKPDPDPFQVKSQVKSGVSVHRGAREAHIGSVADLHHFAEDPDPHFKKRIRINCYYFFYSNQNNFFRLLFVKAAYTQLTQGRYVAVCLHTEYTHDSRTFY